MSTFAGIPIVTSNGAVLFKCCLNVDADGSPRAYGPAGLVGLDYLANAGYKGNWWALACDNSGIPYVQGVSDPAPGYYVSTTALQDGGQPVNKTQRYVDASSVPFFVMPSNFQFGVELGDLGMAFNVVTGDSSPIIIADIGPKNQIGEGSVKLAQNLAIDCDAKNGGTQTKKVLVVIFKGSKITWKYGTEFTLAADKHFVDFGGMSQLSKLGYNFTLN